MGRVDLRQDLKSLSEFRADAAAVIAQVRRTKRPVVLTQHGRSAAVLLERVELLRDVQRAERQLAAGQGIAHEDAEARVLSRLPE